MDKKLELIEHEAQLPESPFAKYQGTLKLGENEVDCYVSDKGQRLISLRATMKAIADRDGGNLAEYIGVNALKPFIDAGFVAAELIELSIPGLPSGAKCLEARKFLDVCRA